MSDPDSDPDIVLAHDSFPHVFEAIIDASSYDVKLVLRATCRGVRDNVDGQLFRHVLARTVEDRTHLYTPTAPFRRLPALSAIEDWVPLAPSPVQKSKRKPLTTNVSTSANVNENANMRTDTDTIEQRTSKVHDLLLPPVTAPTKQFDNVSVVDYLPSAGMSHISLPFRNLQTLRVPPDVSHMWTPVFIPEYHALTRGHEVVRFNTPRAQAGYRMPKSEGKLTLHVPVCPVRWSYSLPFDAPAVDLVFHPAAVDYSRGNARMYLSYLIQIGIFVGLVTKQKGQVRVAGLEAAPSVYGQTAHSVVLKRTPLHLRDGVTFMTLENWRSHVDPVVYEPMEIMAEEEVITSAPPRMSIKYQFGDMN